MTIKYIFHEQKDIKKIGNESLKNFFLKLSANKIHLIFHEKIQKIGNGSLKKLFFKTKRQQSTFFMKKYIQKI